MFDNAEDPADLAPWLPGGAGHVLITSRAQGWLEVAVPVEVDVLARAESVAMLVNRVPGLTEADAGRVAEAVGDLPLALAQAAGYMTGTGTAAEQYLELLAARAGQILDRGQPPSYRRSLAAVTQLAFDRLRAVDTAAADTVAVCAFLAPNPVPTAWFPRAAAQLPAPLGDVAADPVAWREVLTRIRQQALARLDEHGLLMHRLTQAIVRGYLPPDQAPAARAAAQALLAANHPGDEELPSTWPGWAQLLAHLLALDPDASTEALTDLTYDAVWYLIRRGHTRAAYDLARRLYQHRLDQLGPDDVRTLGAASSVAIALQNMGHYDQARELYDDTLARVRRMLGQDHPNTLGSASNLANNLSALGEYQAARELDEDTLARRRVLGQDHPDTLTSISNLATDLSALGEHQAARELSEDALARRRRVLGENHPDTLTSVGNLATDLSALGEHQAARELGEDALARLRRVLGENHPDTLTFVSKLRALDDGEALCGG